MSTLRAALTVPAAALLVLALAALPAAAQADRGPPTVSVTGEGRVAATPDLAVITLGVVTEAPEAAAALAENARRLTAVMAVIEAAGVAARDVQTSGLSLAPQWDYERRTPDGQPRLVGYQVSITVSVRLRETARLGGLLDAVVRGGANQFNGLAFALSDPAAQLSRARRRAMLDARRRARAYARAIGAELGPVVSIVEQGGYVPPPVAYQAARMASEAAVPVAEGEVDISASVSVVFELKQ